MSGVMPFVTPRQSMSFVHLSLPSQFFFPCKCPPFPPRHCFLTHQCPTHLPPPALVLPHLCQDGLAGPQARCVWARAG